MDRRSLPCSTTTNRSPATDPAKMTRPSSTALDVGGFGQVVLEAPVSRSRMDRSGPGRDPSPVHPPVPASRSLSSAIAGVTTTNKSATATIGPIQRNRRAPSRIGGRRRVGERWSPTNCRWPQTASRSWAASRLRRWRTALVWIWHTRDSVTPRTLPISARVRLS